VQAGAPRLLGARGRDLAQVTAQAVRWAGWLAPIPLALSALAWWAAAPSPLLSAALVVGLLVFGFVFAVNSSVHSYLILAFSDADRVTRDVGFYYMSNAAGRLLGTLLSGLSYQLGGVALCLATAGGMALASWWAVRRLRSV
ncbi:MAG: MFS transporter, partial [Paracoccaceae bacterium]|nr:MFS transporter [Paracoccaceae bacterium]